jgi:anti-anti-sigma regulatory factor
VYTTLKRAGGKCTFYAPTQKVRMLLKMVRLDTVLDVVEDEATALARVGIARARIESKSGP